MKKQKVLSLVMLAGLMVQSSFAGIEGEGSKGGGGGDARTEGRIDEIRADILKWIEQGGFRSLMLSNGVSHESYAKTMGDFLRPQEVVVTAIKTNEENPNDEELNTRVNGQPKTCKGFFSKKDQRPHILCNVERFWETSESDQYRLVHHEYAGLAMLEKNIGAASDYSISKQITDYLEMTAVLRLAVKDREMLKSRCKLSIEVKETDFRCEKFGRRKVVDSYDCQQNGVRCRMMGLADLLDRTSWSSHHTYSTLKYTTTYRYYLDEMSLVGCEGAALNIAQLNYYHVKSVSFKFANRDAVFVTDKKILRKKLKVSPQSSLTAWEKKFGINEYQVIDEVDQSIVATCTFR